MKYYKTLLYAFFILLFFNHCGNKKQCTEDVVRFPPLTIEELKLIPYQINDTVRFVNGKGDVLTFVCTDSVRKNTSSNPAPMVDCKEHGYDPGVLFDDVLYKNLNCLTNANYNLSILVAGQEDFSVYFLSYNAIEGLPSDTSNCGVIKDNTHAHTDSIACLGNQTINNQTYSNVFKMIYSQTTSIDPMRFDTCYYNKSNGLLQFHVAGDTWRLKL